MNTKYLIASIAVFAVSGAAVAADNVMLGNSGLESQTFSSMVRTGRTRTDVKSELSRAELNGTAQTNSFISPTQDSMTEQGLSRAEAKSGTRQWDADSTTATVQQAWQ